MNIFKFKKNISFVLQTIKSDVKERNDVVRWVYFGADGLRSEESLTSQEIK